MLRGLTKAGLGVIDSDLAFIQLAAKYGFQSVDLDAKTFINSYGIEEAKAILKKYDMQIGSINLPVEWRKSETEFRQGITQLVASAEAAAELGCKKCCTYILPSTDIKPSSLMALAVRRLRTCASILGTYGIRMGLEFVGPMHLRKIGEHPFVWTLEETIELSDAIGLPNVGILLDSYHWYTTGLTTKDIEKLRPDQIVHVHINDAYDLPIEELKDNDRLYVGDGVIDLQGFLTALKKIGFSGTVAQEVLTTEAPVGSVEEIIERTQKGYDAYMLGS
ncbi:sugar phosphate isomerase/epimerase family protein [Gracilibacillus salinarum]|uniref:Sugar phosphate isomerase/epimerase n=1 Tax=Gracilibacillus salinarum TaxID=2932255 RepID=A0ABY4GRI6_9BACI|nr:sugar phosphate isomerase/epimerase family protein [Gracilibacillus salinarum]UOQ86980.1 sugar phosphate isomerase/epimerase [Gracilibacillus salinarum]